MPPIKVRYLQSMNSPASPILLNLLKHHAGALKQFLEQEPDAEQVRKALRRIGHSQMDLYYGTLSPAQLGREALDCLTAGSVNDPEAYIAWLRPHHYKTFTCSDGSAWVFREGQGERYVHLHPGRYSLHTVRIKASTLKTAAILYRHIRMHQLPWPAPRAAINALRTSELALSPLGVHEQIDQLERSVALLLQ